MVAKQKSVVQVKEVGPTWWLPIKPEGDQLGEGGVSEADQAAPIYVAVQDAMSWSIDGDGEVYYGYAVKVGGIYHHKGRRVAKPKKASTDVVELPMELAEKVLEGYDDLESLASIIECYCDDQPKAKHEDEHRGDAKAIKKFRKLVYGQPGA